MADRKPTTPDRANRALRQLLAEGLAHAHLSNELPTGLVNGVNAAFGLAHVPRAASIQVYLNGLLMVQSIDYTVSGKTITFDAGQLPQTGDNLRVFYIKL